MKEDKVASIGCITCLVVFFVFAGVSGYQIFQERQAKIEYQKELTKRVKEDPGYVDEYKIEELEEQVKLWKDIQTLHDSLNDSFYKRRLNGLKHIIDPKKRKIDSLKLELNRLQQRDRYDDDVDL